MKNFLLFIVLFSFTQVSAQRWYSSPAPNARDINSVKIIHPDTVIAAGGWRFSDADTSRAIFLSHNGGLYLWNVPEFDQGNWVNSIDFTNSQNGIAVCDGGRILKTTDGGWHWTTYNAPLKRDLLKIHLIDAQNLVIVGGIRDDSVQNNRQTILRSTNAGQSWNVTLDQQGSRLKSVYFPTASIGYAVGDSGTILKTTNGGGNWISISAPVQRNFNAIWFTDASNGFIVGGNPDNDSIRTILQTTDGGNIWTIKLDQIGSMLRDVHFADANTGYAVGDDATVYKTVDGGQTWNPITIPGTLGDEQFNAVRFYNTDFGYVAGKWGKQFIWNTEVVPEAVTVSATLHDSLEVTFSGLVDANNEIAAYGFVFSPNLDSTQYATGYKGIVKNNTDTLVFETFTHLLPDTQYSYFFEAFTMGGRVRGDTLTFRTGSATARISTLDATNVSSTGATLNGSIRGYSFPMNLFFEYGTTTAFGNQIAASPASVNDSSLQSVTANLSGLQNNMLYYFRLKAVSGTTNYHGNTMSFFNGLTVFTALQTLPATNITDTSATLNALANGFQVPANISFEYSADSMIFDQSTQILLYLSDTAQHVVSANISNLTPATPYYFRAKAETGLETVYGDTILFYSRLTGNYSVKTNPATGVTATFAQLHGEVSALTEPVDLSFEYGTTLAMVNTVPATPASVSDGGTYAITADLTGLQPNMVYYYRLSAKIAAGAKLYGEIRQLYTGSGVIPNWDFQQWEQNTYLLPERWNILGEDYERVPGHSGNYALKVSNTTVAMLGTLYDSGTDAPGFAAGVPFHARADSIAFYANYYVEPGDSAILLIHLYDTAYNDICTGLFSIKGTSGGQFKQLAFAIPYSSALTPDTLVLALIPTTPEARVSTSNFFIIDDVTAISPASTVPFGDLESWIDIQTNVLSGWFYPKHGMIYDTQPSIVTQAIFNAPDDYAAELQNIYIGNGRWIGSEISNKNSTFDKTGGFPVYARHQTLNGYLKWLPENGDTTLLTVTLYHQGNPIGDGRLTRTTAASDFIAFDIPITYTMFGVTPDTAQINIRTYNRKPPKGASHLFIDKLSFDGFVGISENNFTAGTASPSITIYPNPTAAEVTIHLDKQIQNGTLVIHDLHGKVLHTANFSGERVTIDTHDFSKGLYLVSVQQDNKRLTSRFIVVR